MRSFGVTQTHQRIPLVASCVISPINGFLSTLGKVLCRENGLTFPFQELSSLFNQLLFLSFLPLQNLPDASSSQNLNPQHNA